MSDGVILSTNKKLIYLLSHKMVIPNFPFKLVVLSTVTEEPDSSQRFTKFWIQNSSQRDCFERETFCACAFFSSMNFNCENRFTYAQRRLKSADTFQRM